MPIIATMPRYSFGVGTMLYQAAVHNKVQAAIYNKLCNCSKLCSGQRHANINIDAWLRLTVSTYWCCLVQALITEAQVYSVCMHATWLWKFNAHSMCAFRATGHLLHYSMTAGIVITVNTLVMLLLHLHKCHMWRFACFRLTMH